MTPRITVFSRAAANSPEPWKLKGSGSSSTVYASIGHRTGLEEYVRPPEPP